MPSPARALVLSGALFAGAFTPAAAETIAYTYDRDGRLTRAAYDGAFEVRYEYDPSGNITRILSQPVTGVGGGDGAAPRVLVVGRSVPNPFAAATQLPFDLPRAGRVDLAIYDVGGRRVRTLVAGVLPAGRHAADWDGRDEEGRGVASGVYFVRLAAGGERVTRAVAVLR